MQALYSAPVADTEGSSHPVVSIRRVELSDGESIERYASDPFIAATSHVPHPYPRGGGLEFAVRAASAWRARSEYSFAVTLDGQFCGLVSLMGVNHLRASAQLGYWIGVPYWGRGIATEAVRLARARAFGDLQFQELGAACLAVNLASARVLEKNQFVEQAPFAYDGADLRFKGQRIRTFRLTREGAVDSTGHGRI